MIQDLYHWWAEQMRDLVPASLRFRPAAPTGLVAALDVAESSVSWLHQTRRGRTELGRFALDDPGLCDAAARHSGAGRAVTVEVDEGAVLRHRTVLRDLGEATPAMFVDERQIQPALHKIGTAPNSFDFTCTVLAFRAVDAKVAGQ